MLKPRRYIERKPSIDGRKSIRIQKGATLIRVLAVAARDEQRRGRRQHKKEVLKMRARHLCIVVLESHG